MKKMRLWITVLLAIAVAFALAACGGEGGEETDEENTSGCEYNFESVGFGFDLPKGVKIKEGSIDAYELGEVSYGSGITVGWPVYRNMTGEEIEKATEETAGKMRTGQSFIIICADGGRSLDDIKDDYIEASEKENGGKVGKEALELLEAAKELHKEGDYTWLVIRCPKADGLGDYQEEYDAFYDATDEILEGMSFFEPKVWKGSKEGTAVTFETEDLEGKAVKSADVFSENDVTMVNIWVTDSEPSVDDLSEMEKLNEKFKDDGGAVVGVIGDVFVGDDTGLDAAKEIIKDRKVTYPNLRAWDGFADTLTVMAMPTTYFVDKEGKVIGEPIVGAYPDKCEETMEKLLED